MQHDSQWAAIRSIAAENGCWAETLKKSVCQAERDTGRRPGLTTEERARLRSWSGRAVSSGGTMNSCERRPGIPPRRSSTADGGEGWRSLTRREGQKVEPIARRCRSLQSDLALDALEQALYERQDEATDAPVHDSDRGARYLSIRHTERVAEAGIKLSVGSRGDSYYNVLAESAIGLCQTEVIWRRGPRRFLEDVEFATLEWVW